MKFSKELDRSLTPEWRPKYLNYRVGKKHVKGIARSTIQLQNLTATLNSPSVLLPEAYSQTTRFSGSQSIVSEDDDLSSFGDSEYGDTVPLSNIKANPRLAFPGRATLAAILPRTEDQDLKMAREALNQLQQRTKEYHTWLGEELQKVEAFYKLKEDEARNRLGMLRYQLQEMQQQRPETTAKSSPSPPKSHAEVARQDYIRRSSHAVPYRSAKGQLRLVLEEFYGALDMLKSYALLNQKAFRKINKKYKKVTDPNLGATKPNNIRVDQSNFVQSTLLESFLTSTRDLYAEHFENGNKKRATKKLRATIEGFGDETGRSFYNGLLLGTAGIFLAHGISSAIQFLDDPNPLVRYHTKVLLQIYGGYFLMLYLFCMFCYNCTIWQSHKINYIFIFEFDRRNNLSISELAKYPNTFLLLLGITIYANFRIEIEAFSIFFLYWPVFLMGLTLLIIFFPAPIMGPHSRKWLLISHYRLFTAGLNTVEFRDVFLGDMYTSLGFSLGNIGFFLCIYSARFDGAQCDINHIFLASLVAGLPAIWRLLQCLRRYNDSMAAFPHLVNGGKYIFSLLFTVTLNFYRLDGSFLNLILLMVAAVISAIYSSLWDIYMDFSLFAPNTSILTPTLRPTRVFKSKSIYIIIAILNVMLRFSWVLLVLFAHSEKFQVLVSFLVGFGEVTRRSMWMLLRVENEHCANLGGLKAYRQLEFPYQLITREELAFFGPDEKSAAGVDEMV